MTGAAAAPRAGRWRPYAAAALVFVLLIIWHFWPLFPVMASSVPDSQDMCNNTAELLSTMRTLLRHPWAPFEGQYTYPYRFSNALLNMNVLLGIPYYAVYSLSDNACLAYNGMLLAEFFLNAFAVFVLVRAWTRSWLGAVAAGALCAFYTHRFHDLQDYHYQQTFSTILVVWAWHEFLARGQRGWLLAFFGLLAAKAVTLDYQTIYLLAVLLILVPVGVVAYPRSVWRHKWLFAGLSAGLVLLLAPLYYPYWFNGFCQPPCGWVNAPGVGRLDFLTWREYSDLWRNLVHNIMHVRERTTYIVDAPRLPGALSATLSMLGAAWALAAPLWHGRRGLVRAGLVLAALAATMLFIGPLVNYGGTFYGYTPLARYYVAPPVLAVARTTRAFVHAMLCMWCLLGGLLLGDVLAWAWRSARWRWPAHGAAAVLLVLITLEHTPKPNPYVSYWVAPRAGEVYRWLAQQPRPSPVIETPYERGGNSYRRACDALLAGQPTGTSIGRIWPAWSYFLLQELEQPLTPRGLRLLEALPYRFWIHHGLSHEQCRWVTTHSSLMYTTNFGPAYVFENPRPGRAARCDLVVTQDWMLSFPYVYVVRGTLTLSNEFCFVPRGQRRLVARLVCRDSRSNELARFRVRAELPMILEGPASSFALTVQYNPAARRATAAYRASGMFSNEKWPGDSVRCDDRILDTRSIDVTVSLPGMGRCAAYTAALREPPDYWPYRWGVPECMPCLAGGSEQFDVVDGLPCQATRGTASAVCLGAPPQPGNTLVLTARAAPGIPPPLWLSLTLNNYPAGQVLLSNVWQPYHFTIPTSIWRAANVFIFRYPRTVIPCLIRPEEIDTQPRCAVLAVLDVTNTARAAPVCTNAQVNVVHSGDGTPAQTSPRHPTLLLNGDFSGGLAHWDLWQHAALAPQLVTMQHECQAGATTLYVHISNPKAKLTGIQQTVAVSSGQTYRLRAAARSDGNDDARIFGARAAVYLPPEPERELVWPYETNAWVYKECVFTCHTSGVAVVYLHMGYGQVASTGAFTDIALEKLP